MSDGRWYFVAVGAMTAGAALWRPEASNAVGLALVAGWCLGQSLVLWIRSRDELWEGVEEWPWI